MAEHLQRSTQDALQHEEVLGSPGLPELMGHQLNPLMKACVPSLRARCVAVLPASPTPIAYEMTDSTSYRTEATRLR